MINVSVQCIHLRRGRNYTISNHDVIQKSIKAKFILIDINYCLVIRY